MPPITLAFFDPGEPAGYRTASSEALPLEVRALPEGARRLAVAGEMRAAVPGYNDIYGRRTGSDSARTPTLALSPILLVVVLLMPWLAAAGLMSWLRVRAHNLADPLGVRARRAFRRFRFQTRRHDVEMAFGLSEYVAARLRCPVPMVIAPQLHAQLLSAGIPDVLTTRTVELLEALVAARYGGDQVSGAQEKTRALVNELEEVFRAVEANP